MATTRTQRRFMLLIVAGIILYGFHSDPLHHWSWTGYTSQYAAYSDIPQPIVEGVNCRRLFLDEEDGGKYALNTSKRWNLPVEHFITASTNCSGFIETRKYIMRPINAEEASYPLAFSLVVYKNAHQVEQLLRAIYRPQNYYCIHVDTKAKPAVYQALSNIAGCFKNVVMASQRSNVIWATMSVLDPELTCMADLWNKTDWKYFINLTGQEFPLKTNLEIVQILKAFNGSNAIGINYRHYLQQKVRVTYHFLHGPVINYHKYEPKQPAPHNMTLSMGPLHVALTRSYVDFVLHNKIAQDFKEWLNDTDVPDETFFQTLQVNPQLGVPGAYTGNVTRPVEELDTFARYKRWYNQCSPGSQSSRGVCILGMEHLADLARAREMFANKFFPDYQPVARMCLEELLFNRTRAQMRGGFQINPEPYKKPLFVKQHTLS